MVTVKDLPFNFHDGVNWIGLDHDTIFFCGNEENSPESAFSFNYTTNNLARLADMKKAHMNHGCLKYEQQIYVFGGFVDQTCEKYSLNENSWTQISDLPVKMSSVTITGIDDTLYAAAFQCDQIAVYDIPNNTFHLMEYRLPSSQHHRVYSVGNDLFVLDNENTYQINVDNERDAVLYSGGWSQDWLYGQAVMYGGKVYFIASWTGYVYATDSASPNVAFAFDIRNPN